VQELAAIEPPEAREWRKRESRGVPTNALYYRQTMKDA